MQISLENLLEELSGLEKITNPTQVAKLSEDYAHFSPVLVPLLTGKVGDVVVRPSNESEVLRIAQICVKYQIPLTVRGSG
ncbi:MAG: FAD-binding protein, partial [Pseudanabaena sp.]